VKIKQNTNQKDDIDVPACDDERHGVYLLIIYIFQLKHARKLHLIIKKKQKLQTTL
jgi:hypothetical protein